MSGCKPDKTDAIDVLSKVGGLDIAGLAGVYLGGAIYRIPVLIDGFISAVAALVAVRLVPECAGYILPSHLSDEPASRKILDALEKNHFLHVACVWGKEQEQWQRCRFLRWDFRCTVKWELLMIFT